MRARRPRPPPRLTPAPTPAAAAPPAQVLKGTCLKTGRPVAIKCMKHAFDSAEDVAGLREVQALRRLSPHPNIVTLYEVL